MKRIWTEIKEEHENDRVTKTHMRIARIRTVALGLPPCIIMHRSREQNTCTSATTTHIVYEHMKTDRKTHARVFDEEERIVSHKHKQDVPHLLHSPRKWMSRRLYTEREAEKERTEGK